MFQIFLTSTFVCVVMTQNLTNYATTDATVEYRLSPGVYLRESHIQPLIYAENAVLHFQARIDSLERKDYLDHATQAFCLDVKNARDQSSEQAKANNITCGLLTNMNEGLNKVEDHIDLLRVVTHSFSAKPLQERKKRQAILAAALVSYASYKVFDYFGSGNSASHAESSLQLGLEDVQKHLVNQSRSVQLFEKKLNKQMNDLTVTYSSLLANTTIWLGEQIRNVNQGLYRNMLTDLNIINELGRTLDVMSFNSILQDCRRNQLPMFMIPKYILSSELGKLERRLGKHNQKLSIPINSMSGYYHYDLAVCKFNPSTKTIHVYLSVPLKPIRTEFKLYIAQAVPFVHYEKINNRQQICQVDLSYNTVIFEGNKGYLVEGSQPTHCNINSNICHFTRHRDTYSLKGACLHALLDGTSIENLKSVCPIICATNNKDNVVLELDFNVYGVISTRDFNMECFPNSLRTESEKQIVKRVPVSLHNHGLFVLKIPCNCRIHFISTNHYFNPPLLCRQTVTGPSAITVTLPIHWGSFADDNINVKAATLTEGLYQFLPSPNISHLLNWTNIPVTPVQTSTWHAHFYNYSDSYTSYTMIIWNVILTALLAHLFFKNCTLPTAATLYSLVSTRETRADEAGANSSLSATAPVPAAAHGASQRHYVFLITMLIVNVVLIVSCILIIVCVIKRHRANKMQRPVQRRKKVRRASSSDDEDTTFTLRPNQRMSQVPGLYGFNAKDWPQFQVYRYVKLFEDATGVPSRYRTWLADGIDPETETRSLQEIQDAQKLKDDLLKRETKTAKDKSIYPGNQLKTLEREMVLPLDVPTFTSLNKL